MQCDFVFITAGKCCINWCVALHRPGGSGSLSLTLSRSDQRLSISQYMKTYVNGKINFYNIGPRVCCWRLFCGTVSRCVYVCACTCALLLAGLIFFRMHAAQKALGRRALVQINYILCTKLWCFARHV